MMMKIQPVLVLSLILFFPILYANASPGDAELVIENIQIDPAYPQIDELVSITVDVYNAGILETSSLSSIITVAYFVDDKLLYVDQIENIKPGLSNKIKISSIPIWNAESGNHTVKAVLDYHDTLNDQRDSPDDNAIQKTFSIEPRNPIKLLLEASPQYITENTDILLEITVSVEDYNSGKPLNNKKILVHFDDDDIPLTTDTSGTISFSKMINSSDKLTPEVYFEGDDQYLPSSSSLSIYSIPMDLTSGMLIKITDKNQRFNFEDHSFEFAIFQDSYDTLFKKISPLSTLLDTNAFWVSLPSGHNYFTEVYLDGRFLFLTPNMFLQQNNFLVNELIVPDPAEIRFKVVDEFGEPQPNAIINNWIYSAVTDENGLTDWIEVLPTINDVPYVAEILLPDQKIIQSDQFLVFSEERKTIEIIISTNSDLSEIPDWIRNNAGWWANNQIDDDSFIEGMRFLIKEDILKIPPTFQTSEQSSVVVPDWIRNNAGWWANNQIDDDSFIEGIQFLIKKGILKIQ